VLWTYRYPCKFKDHNYEGGTSSTPTIDGNNVYVLAYDGQLHCLELLTGKLVWKRHLVTDFGGRYSSWDYAASPLVVGNRVILDTGADGNSTVALDKSDGTLLWGNGNDLAGYATPISYRAGNVKMVLVFKARALIAHDVSSGQQVWRIPWKTNYDVNASSPIAVGKQLFVSSGYGGRRARGALFDLQSGNPEEQWVNDDIETKMNSAVVVDEHAYCLSERAAGQLMCVRLKDGVTVWREESFSPYGALMVAAGTLIILDEDGQLVLADAASRGFHQRGRLAVLSSRSWAMPVLANGFIYVRSNAGELVAVDVRKRG
ncbi:MAG: PQQ-like beta-propeller repeat protein, partial [Planctomycetales bacterium]|nr:PQQ-like beta-propeller repeat protein [Planctomycetales bacterium]